MTYHQYRRMCDIWRAGGDTYDIATELQLPEATVAERLSIYLKHIRRARVAA